MRSELCVLFVYFIDTPLDALFNMIAFRVRFSYYPHAKHWILKHIQSVFMHKRLFFSIIAVSMALLLPIGAEAQIGQVKEAVMSHVEADPLTIGGQLGGEMNMSWNNQDIYGYSDPFAFAAYANFDIGIYGFHIPINLNLLNLSMTQFTFPHPQITINTTPEWKKFRFHIGTSSMHFNNYTYSGLTFTGGGIEYNGDLLRVAGFYGKLNRKTRFKDDRTAIQYFADSLLGINQQETTQPQFDRNAWGAKIGVGNTKNYIDFSVMKAKDDIESLPVTWQYESTDSTIYRDSILKGKENFTTGLSGRFSIGKWFSFNANMAMSLYSDDMSSRQVTKENISSIGADTTDPILQRTIGILDNVRGIYDARLNTQIRFAGDAAMNFTFDKFNAVLTYRLVQADFTSLGANKFSQNVQGFGTSANYRFFKNRSILTVSGFLQQDNLDHRQMYTNQVASYSANWNFSVTDNLNFAAAYSGVKQDQKDGTLIVNDTLRVNQIMHSVTFSPSYTIFSDNEHTISINFNDVANKNLNTLSTNRSNVNTLTIGAGYDCNITAKRVGIGANYDFSNSKAPGNDYTSHTLSGSLSYNAIKNDNMSLKLSGSVSFSYNVKPYEQTGYEGVVDDEEEIPVSADYTTNDFSFSARIGSSFTYKNQHNASFFLSTSNYSENIVFGQKISTTMDLRFNLSYSYSFFSRVIKSKKETERLQKQSSNEKILR